MGGSVYKNKQGKQYVVNAGPFNSVKSGKLGIAKTSISGMPGKPSVKCSLSKGGQKTSHGKAC